MRKHKPSGRRTDYQIVGMAGEALVAQTLKDAGLAISMTKPGQKQGDLIIRAAGREIKLEVKAARPQKNGGQYRRQFILAKDKHTDHRHADYVALVCLSDTCAAVIYIVPVSALANNRQVVIYGDPALYRGKFAAHLQTPEMFADVCKRP